MILATHFFGAPYSAEVEGKVFPILGKTKEELDDLRDHAIDDGWYDQELHDAILNRIENTEEDALGQIFQPNSRGH